MFSFLWNVNSHISLLFAKLDLLIAVELNREVRMTKTNLMRQRLVHYNFVRRQKKILPSTYTVWGKVLFSVMSMILFAEGGGCPWLMMYWDIQAPPPPPPDQVGRGLHPLPGHIGRTSSRPSPHPRQVGRGNPHPLYTWKDQAGRTRRRTNQEGGHNVFSRVLFCSQGHQDPASTVLLHY